MPNTCPAARLVTIVGLMLSGCIPLGPGHPTDQFVTEEVAVGGNDEQAVLTWTRSEVYSCLPSNGMCLAVITVVPIEKEFAVLDLASLGVATTPLSAQSAVATDGQWLVIQDYDAAIIRIHDLQTDTDVAQLPIALQRPEYDLPIAVAKPFVLLAYDPDLAEDDPTQPVVLNVTTGEKRVVPDIQVAAAGWCALSPDRLAYLSLENQIVLLDLGTGTSSVIAAGPLSIVPPLAIVGERVIWPEFDEAENKISVRSFDTASGTTTTVTNWPAGGLPLLVDVGEPGLLLGDGDVGAMAYRLVGFDGSSRQVIGPGIVQEVFARPKFSGDFILYPLQTGGWGVLDTRDDSSRTVNVFPVPSGD